MAGSRLCPLKSGRLWSRLRRTCCLVCNASTGEHGARADAQSRTYKGGFTALHNVDLRIEKGEIFALLGPNGAGKTTLISIICGIVTPSTGTIRVAGHDALIDYKAARRRIGLVPQELSVDMFETVLATVAFSRRLFGRSGNSAHIEQVSRDLPLWDKHNARIMELSGGMKRRVLIANVRRTRPARAGASRTPMSADKSAIASTVVHATVARLS